MELPSAANPLTAEAMRGALEAVMAGDVAAAQVEEFLRALAARGETAEEIAGGAAALRAHAVAVPLRDTEGLCDTCGTGGDGAGTINASTLAGLVAAAAGVRIAKHGNRAASSRCGSADVLEALGVNLEASPAQVARCLEETRFGFCFAPRFHPAMRAVAPIRKALGIRTIFNLIGPLANPLPLTYQVVGVADEALLDVMAGALRQLGVRRALVVHGMDGLDEATTTGVTVLREVSASGVTARRLTPEAAGLPRARPVELQGGAPADNARIAEAVLAGHPSAARDLVALNAGCALYAAGRAATIAEGTTRAGEVLASGAARQVLARVKELSRDAG